MACSGHTKRTILTLLSPLITHFYIPIPVVLVGFARRDYLLYVFLPIVIVVTFISSKISYGPVTLYPTIHFTIPAVVLFTVVLVSSIFFAKYDRAWRVLFFTLILISVLHSMTPVFENPYSGSGCNEFTVNFLDSRTVYCISVNSATLPGNATYFHVTVFPWNPVVCWLLRLT